jgi:O-glycosyl hydrolase
MAGFKLSGVRLSVAAATAIGIAAAVSAVTPANAATTLQVSGTKAQTIDNIGASGAWWVNDLAKFSAENQQKAADLLFGSDGLALSAYRYNIGGGGVGVSQPTRAPQTFQTSPGQYNWSRDAAGRTFLSMASKAGVKDIVGFVNSAPAVWTSNGKTCGGGFASGNEAAYAKYLADIVQHFADAGTPIDYLSPMNEPQVSQSGCIQEGMSVAASRRDDIVRAVGAELKARGLATGIIADESNKVSNFNSEAPTWIGQSGTSQYVSALAHHTYDNPSQSTLNSAKTVGKNAGKKLWATEVCCFNGIGKGWAQQYDPTITGGLALADVIYRDFAYANDSAFHWWTALSPKLGCDPKASSSCATSVNSSGWNDGLIYYDPNFASNGNQTLYTTKRYSALGQFSKFVRPGAVRYPITGAPSGVQALAFENAGTWTVVVINTNTSSTALSLQFAAANSGLTATRAYITNATNDVHRTTNPTVSGSTVSLTAPARGIATYMFSHN